MNIFKKSTKIYGRTFVLDFILTKKWGLFVTCMVCFVCRTFNTTVDIKLKQWADAMLPKKCVEVR